MADLGRTATAVIVACSRGGVLAVQLASGAGSELLEGTGFTSVDFIDDDNGLAISQRGDDLGSRRLFLTHDGGKIWRQANLPPANRP